MGTSDASIARASEVPARSVERSSTFRASHFFVLASLMAATVAVVMSRQSTPEHLVLISLTIASAGLAAAGFYRMMSPLVGDLSIAAGEIMYGPALARAIAQWQAPGEAARAALIAQRVLGFIESHLAGRRFLAADHATLADLACYGYLAHAPEGGNGLDAYPALRSWLKRVEALPDFVAMPDLPLP